MKLYTVQEENNFYEAVSVSRAGNTLSIAVTTRNTEDGEPRVDTYNLDYASLSARSDFADRTQWAIGYSSGNEDRFKIYNSYKETLPTKASGSVFAGRDGVSVVASLCVPFADSSLDDCALQVVCPNLENITADSSFSAPVVLANRAVIRGIVFPSLRAVSVTPVGSDVDVVLQLTLDSADVARSAELLLTCNFGRVSSERPVTDTNGQVTVRIYTDPHLSGKNGTLNAGFPFWTGAAYISYQLP